MRQGMIAVAFIALGLYRVELGVLVLISSLAFIAARSLMVGPDGTRRRRLAVSYFVTLACLYLPYLWLFVVENPWDEYVWFWIKTWPVLPGFAVGLPFHPNDTAEWYAMGVGTVVLVALFTWLGSLGRAALIGSGAVALIGSGLQSWLSYACFMM